MAYATDPQPVLDVMRAHRPPWQIHALADELGVSRSHLYNVVHGRARPSPRVIELLPVVLGVPLTQLFETGWLDKPWRGPGRNHHVIANERQAAKR